VLDLIESVVKDVPLLKRSKVKSAALELVAELYNKHHDLLESAGCVDRVEQSYYQLKG
jgi:tRNA G10  N-methylase Trm11